MLRDERGGCGGILGQVIVLGHQSVDFVDDECGGRVPARQPFFVKDVHERKQARVVGDRIRSCAFDRLVDDGISGKERRACAFFKAREVLFRVQDDTPELSTAACMRLEYFKLMATICVLDEEQPQDEPDNKR